LFFRYVVKDLVPDMTLFYQQYGSVQPWLQKNKPLKLGEKEMYQTIEERASLVNIFLIIFSHLKFHLGWSL